MSGTMSAYKILKKIGSGNFGTCHLCESENGKLYVIKQISIKEMNENERDASQQESKVLSELRHPFIIGYRESFIENDMLNIVMHYAEGGDLATLIKQRNGVHFDETTILDWFVQICLALRYCHQRRIIHRDLKTQNVFLTKKHNIRLGDFGIARVLNGTNELAMSVVGTPYSLSPEVCSSQPYSFKSDIWALGCVLYEMCVLKHAFDANNFLALVWKIVSESYPPIPDIYSSDLSALIARMLAKDPNDRPSIDEILECPFIRNRLKAQINAKLSIRKGSVSKEGTMNGNKAPPRIDPTALLEQTVKYTSPHSFEQTAIHKPDLTRIDSRTRVNSDPRDQPQPTSRDTRADSVPTSRPSSRPDSRPSSREPYESPTSSRSPSSSPSNSLPNSPRRREIGISPRDAMKLRKQQQAQQREMELAAAAKMSTRDRAYAQQRIHNEFHRGTALSSRMTVQQYTQPPPPKHTVSQPIPSSSQQSQQHSHSHTTELQRAQDMYAGNNNSYYAERERPVRQHSAGSRQQTPPAAIPHSHSQDSLHTRTSSIEERDRPIKSSGVYRLPSSKTETLPAADTLSSIRESVDLPPTSGRVVSEPAMHSRRYNLRDTSDDEEQQLKQKEEKDDVQYDSDFDSYDEDEEEKCLNELQTQFQTMGKDIPLQRKLSNSKEVQTVISPNRPQASNPSRASFSSTPVQQPTMASKYAAVKASCLRKMTPNEFNEIYDYLRSKHGLSSNPGLKLSKTDLEQKFGARNSELIFSIEQLVFLEGILQERQKSTTGQKK